ncbi:MAG TPA: AraC family ligand binding domain-containing protein [Gemmatimonadales bacterium]|nr:AraC family ligand binding domain-containing protein [Gemmatimonadales bacterium]
MSLVNRAVTGTALSFDLESELKTVREQLEQHARTGRTLVKDGPLRMTLVGLRPGGAMVPHQADGPISIQVLEGSVIFEAEERKWTLESGALLALRSRVVHSVQSEDGGIFLLTVLAVDDAVQAQASSGGDSPA